MDRPAELAMRLVLADCGQAPVPDMTPGERREVNRFFAQWFHHALLDMARGDEDSVAETVRTMLHHYQATSN